MMTAERFERFTLTAILTVVGGAAGAASFSHVHAWTMANSPTGTADWFGWANACISELVPIAALLTMRQRRRAGKGVGYPMFLLIAAALLSLSAQLAVAKPGLTGGLLAAVPSLAFMALSKLVLSAKPAQPATVPASVRATVTDNADNPATVSHSAPTLADTPATVPPVSATAPPLPATMTDHNPPVRVDAAPAAARVRKIAATMPTATAAEIAALAKCSERTVHRYRKAASDVLADTAAEITAEPSRLAGVAA